MPWNCDKVAFTHQDQNIKVCRSSTAQRSLTRLMCPGLDGQKCINSENFAFVIFERIDWSTDDKSLSHHHGHSAVNASTYGLLLWFCRQSFLLNINSPKCWWSDQRYKTTSPLFQPRCIRCKYRPASSDTVNNSAPHQPCRPDVPGTTMACSWLAGSVSGSDWHRVHAFGLHRVHGREEHYYRGTDL